MSDPTCRLVLLRHASAERRGPEGDASRPLSAQGHAEASRMGQWLSREGLLGDVVVCSPSVRTRATWADVEEATGHGVLVEMEPAIYEADVETLLRVVRDAGAVHAEASTIMLVGHVPAVPAMAYDLTGGSGEPGDVEALTRGFVPASVAVVSWAGSWGDLAVGGARLDAIRLGSEA